MAFRPFLVALLIGFAVAGCARAPGALDWSTDTRTAVAGWAVSEVSEKDAALLPAEGTLRDDVHPRRGHRVREALRAPLSLAAAERFEPFEPVEMRSALPMPYTLDTGDRVRVFVFDQPDLSRIYPVDDQGYISVPLIGRVRARGKTAAGLERAVAQVLGRTYVRDPQVTVDIQQNRPFFILGEVRSPGQYPFVNGMTVKTAVAIAGGFSERALRMRAKVSRRINGVVEVLDVPSDYVLSPGDTVEVPERFL